MEPPAPDQVRQPAQPETHALGPRFPIARPSRITAQARHQPIGRRQRQIARQALAFFFTACQSTASSSSV